MRIVIDIGYGDATEPGLNEIELLTLLDQPAPKLRAYPPETVIAEKFQAMVHLGLANTRLKDFYDIWVLTRTYEFKDDRLSRAIKATFTRRKTNIPEDRPDALTKAFTTRPRFSNGTRSFRTSLSILDRLPMLSPRLALS